MRGCLTGDCSYAKPSLGDKLPVDDSQEGAEDSASYHQHDLCGCGIRSFSKQEVADDSAQCPVNGAEYPLLGMYKPEQVPEEERQKACDKPWQKDYADGTFHTHLSGFRDEPQKPYPEPPDDVRIGFVGLGEPHILKVPSFPFDILSTEPVVLPTVKVFAFPPYRVKYPQK